MTQDIRAYFESLENGYDDAPMETLCAMIDLFPSSGYEHDIYHAIILWVGMQGTQETIAYIDALDPAEYDAHFLDILYTLKDTIRERISAKNTP